MSTSSWSDGNLNSQVNKIIIALPHDGSVILIRTKFSMSAEHSDVKQEADIILVQR